MENKINLQDLAKGVAKRCNVPQKTAETFLHTMFQTIQDALKTERIVKIKRLGTFKLVEMESRESVNVNTGERITIPPYTKITFTPEPTMRDAVNRPFAQFKTVIINEGTDIRTMESLDDIEPQTGDIEPQTGDIEPQTDDPQTPQTPQPQDPTTPSDPPMPETTEQTTPPTDTKTNPLDIETPTPMATDSTPQQPNPNTPPETSQELPVLHVKTLHVEQQTIQNQHIVNPASDRKRPIIPTPWAIFLSLLLVLLLMITSYYAGNAHLLDGSRPVAPEAPIHQSTVPENPKPTPVPTPEPADTNTLHGDSLPLPVKQHVPTPEIIEQV